MSVSRRSLFRTAAAALAVGMPRAGVSAPADPVVLEFAVAGGSYYGLPAALPGLAVGETLQLRREPQNRRDRFAIAVNCFGGAKLGYIPRIANQTLARLMDAGWRADATIAGFVDSSSLDGIAFTSTSDGEPRVRVTLSRR